MCSGGTSWRFCPLCGRSPLGMSPQAQNDRMPGGFSDLLFLLGECCALAPNKNTNAIRKFGGIIHLKCYARTKYTNASISGVVNTSHM